MPSACAPSRTGVSSAHSAVREDIDPTGTPMCMPRARAQHPPAASRRRRPSAARRHGGRPRRPGRAGPRRAPTATPPRRDPSGRPSPAAAGCAGLDRHRRVRLGQQLQHVGDDGRAAEGRHQDRAWAGHRRPAARTAPPPPGPPPAGPAPRRSPAREGSRASPAQRAPAGRPERSRRGRAWLPLASADGQSRVDRASSTSSTGMPSSIRYARRTTRSCSAARDAPGRRRRPAGRGIPGSAGSRAATARSWASSPSSVLTLRRRPDRSSTSSRTRSIVPRSAASTLSRSSGSVLDARRLNHHIGSPW